MEFASPALLWALLAVPLILLFGLWQTRPVPLTVPSLRLWERLRERNPPMRELRRPALRASLILQALAAAFLLAGIAGPQRVGTRSLPRLVFLMLDDSASMGARGPDGRTRWDLAREAAAAVAAQAGPDERLVVVPGHAAAGRYEGSPAGVAAFLAEFAPSACGEEGVLRAARLLAAEAGAGPGRPLVVVTDHRSAALDEAVRAAGGRVVTVGGPVSNGGILAFAAEPLPDGGARAFVRCSGPPGTAADVEIEGSPDGIRWPPPLAFLKIPLSETGEGTAVIPLERLPTHRILRVRRVQPDALDADDTAWAVWPGDRDPVAYYYSSSLDRPGNLARVLQAVPGLPLDTRAVAPGSRAPVHERGRLVVYDGVAPERLPEGRWVVLADPPASVPPFEVGAPSEMSPDAWRTVPPLTDHVDLQSIGVRRARPCRFTGPDGALQAVLESRAHGPVLARWERPGGPVIYAGFGLAWRGGIADSDAAWALDPGFAIFWKNVVDAVYSEADVRPGERWRAGRTCVPLSPAREAAGPVRGPGGSSSADGEEPGPPRIRVHRAGLVTVEGEGGLVPVGAANLFDASESACESGGGEEAAAFRLPPSAEGRRVRPLAGLCAAAAGALLAVAWWLARRT